MAKEIANSGVPASSADVLIGYYVEAQKKLREMILHPKGTKESSRQFYQARAAQQLAQVDQILKELKAHTTAWVGANIPAAYLQGIKLAQKQAKSLGVADKGNLLQGSFNQLDHGAIELSAKATYSDLAIKAAGSMADTAKRLLRQTAQLKLGEAEINKILAGGLIDGEPAATIKALRDALIRAHGGQLVTVFDKNGDTIHYDAGHYAKLVVRTKTRQAVVTARNQRQRDLGMDLVAIIGGISKNFCTAFLGQVYSLSGKSDKYPAYDSLPGGGPPFHPNCSKGTRPFLEELATDAQLDQAEPDQDVGKLLGTDASKAQRIFKDLQLHEATVARYK